MTSRHLYFKLLKEDMKRKLWAAALLGLALFFTLPVAMAMIFSDTQVEGTTTLAKVIAQRTDRAVSILSFGSDYPVVFLILFVAALVLGVSTFAYLHNKKQVDFYHSLPVKRELWFLVHISTGIFLPAAIYLVSILGTLAVCMVSGVRPMGLVLAAAAGGFLGNMLYYILVYATAVLAMMMTGTRLAAVLGTAVFFGYCPMTSVMITGFYEIFFDTYYSGAPSVWSRVIVKLSPIYAIASALSQGLFHAILGTVAAILAIGLISFFLYLKRPSEAAGKTMAFGWSTGIIKVLLVVAFGMAGGMFFYAIQDALPWMVFGVVVGVVISHCVIEVIYHADFKKLFCHEKTMAFCMTAALAITLSFYFDLFRYDDYLPSEGEVAYASIDFGEDNWVAYSIITEPYFTIQAGGHKILDKEQLANTSAVLGIAQEGIRQLDSESYEDENKQWCRVVVCYTLKSGRRVYRNYSLYLDPVMDLADQIYLDPDYKKALYPGLAVDAEEAAFNTAYLDEIGQVKLLSGNQSRWKAVIEAYQQELLEMSMSDRETESPLGELLLMSEKHASLLDSANEERDLNRYERQYWYEGFFYPIYPSFTRTIAALADCGIIVGESCRPENLGAVQIVAYGPFDGDEEGEEDFDARENAFIITYTDPEQIREIMEGFSLNSLRDKNNMVLCSQYRVYPVSTEQYTIEAGEDAEDRNYSNGNNSRGNLIEGRVPDFVIRDFKAEWEKWKESKIGN